MITGYSAKPVAAALEYLLERGFMTTTGRYESWQIKQNVFQLPLASDNPLPDRVGIIPPPSLLLLLKI